MGRMRGHLGYSKSEIISRFPSRLSPFMMLNPGLRRVEVRVGQKNHSTAGDQNRPSWSHWASGRHCSLWEWKTSWARAGLSAHTQVAGLDILMYPIHMRAPTHTRTHVQTACTHKRTCAHSSTRACVCTHTCTNTLIPSVVCYTPPSLQTCPFFALGDQLPFLGICLGGRVWGILVTQMCQRLWGS